MKKILSALTVLVLLASCSTTKKVTYFQDVEPGRSIAMAEAQEIRLKPGDKILIHVNSKDEELVAPLNLNRSNNNSGGGQQIQLAYTVDNDGYIDFPLLGNIHVEGMTRDELAKHLKREIVDNRLVLDAVVIVELNNQQVSVMGEVSAPGKYNIDRDRFTILDALSMAGDLTIQGRRDNIMVLREEYGAQKAYSININDAEQLYSSPAFYLQQNDIVYVEPNSARAGQSTINGNTVRSTSFWMSLASFVLTVVTLITR